jgi:bacterioferritin-associated ferredoxin
VIVCHCKGVSDSSIREAVRDGARSFRQVAKACDAGRRCGGCRPVIRELIDDESAVDVPSTLLPLASATA